MDHASVDIPLWAFIPNNGQTFQPTVASQLAVSASSTATVTSTSATSAPVSSTSSTSTDSTNTTSPVTTDTISAPLVPTNIVSAQSQSRPGPIVGGVVGGLICVVLALALAIILFRKRRMARLRPASASTSSQGMPEKQPSEFGMPTHMHVSHFVPPTTDSSSSLDKYPRATAHPYAANYEVQRNMIGLATISDADPYQYPQTVHGYSTTGHDGSQEPTIYPPAVDSLVSSSGTPGRLGSHPFANPIFQDDYDSMPLTPFDLGPHRTPSPPPAQDLPNVPGSPLPPLRVPQPMRHHSGGAEFSPTSLTSHGSGAPLVTNGGNETMVALHALASVDRFGSRRK